MPGPLSRRFVAALLVMSIATSAWIALRYRALQKEAFSLRLVAAKGVTGERRARAQRQAFIEALGHVNVGRGRLSGYDHVSHRPFVSSGTPDGAYYLLDPLCSACAANLPTLDSMEANAPGSVFALAPYDSMRLESYVATHRVTFPVLGRPTGLLPDIVPRYATPLTVFVANGRIVGIVDGLLDSTAIEMSKAIVSVRTR